jgi:2-C-methyl-D-erythritol 4-phosphate cytidylyltransferase
MRNYAIIVAAGSGTRFGGAKQFIMLRNIPVFVYSMSAFQKNKHIDSILVVVPRARIKWANSITKKYNITKVKHIIPGGKRRQDSVMNGLACIKNQSGIVAIHDSVRPLVDQCLINKGIMLCKKYKAVIFGNRVSDTIKRSKANRIVCTVPRKNMFLIQTPQFFDIMTLKKAVDQADPACEYTDEAAVLEAQNIPVHLFQGQYHNFKITKKQDLALIDKLL